MTILENSLLFLFDPTGHSHLLGVQPKVKAFALIPTVVTQHTNACCSMQVVDITLVKYHFTNIISLRVAQHKHSSLYSST
jgi:hypothetical protein